MLWVVYVNVCLYFDILINITIGKWKDANIRKQFFLHYAAKVGIDSLQATSWYSQNLVDIQNTKVCILFYFFISVLKSLWV
jgi:hypothetical protein